MQAQASIAASSVSTVICETCPSTTASPQIVTRLSGPTTPCAAPALTAIYASGTVGAPTSIASGNSSSTATPPPITNGGSKFGGSVNGAALIVALAAVYVL